MEARRHGSASHTHASLANHSCSIRQKGQCTRAKNTGVAWKAFAIGDDAGCYISSRLWTSDHDGAHSMPRVPRKAMTVSCPSV
jgi:hypothetical protein